MEAFERGGAGRAAYHWPAGSPPRRSGASPQFRAAGGHAALPSATQEGEPRPAAQPPRARRPAVAAVEAFAEADVRGGDALLPHAATFSPELAEGAPSAATAHRGGGQQGS